MGEIILCVVKNKEIKLLWEIARSIPGARWEFTATHTAEISLPPNQKVIFFIE